MEFIGLSPAGLNGIPAEDPAKDAAARRCGELVMDLVTRDVRPSAILDRRALENGIASVAATGGSTNGVLHLLALAREAGIPLEIDDFSRIADADPDRGRHEAGRPLLRVRDVRRRRGGPRHARAAQARPPPRRRADGRRADDRRDRRGRGRDARPAGGRADRDAAQGERRPHDPARHAGPRGLRHQARRPRAAPPPRAGPGLRLRERLLRGREGRDRSAAATSSSSATRARSAAPGCRRCSR